MNASDRYKMSLLTAAQMLHQCTTGAADGNEDGLVGFIVYRLDHWEPSALKSSRRFDEAVREVCLAALAEWAHKRAANQG